MILKERKRYFSAQIKHSLRSSASEKDDWSATKNFLTIAPALPNVSGFRRQSGHFNQRSLSTVLGPNVAVSGNPYFSSDLGDMAPHEIVLLQTTSEGKLHASRSQKDKEKNPDRLCLDRRGLTHLPVLIGEGRIRLLSLQHNLITRLEGFQNLGINKLVFLDIYDNQLQRIEALESFENLRVLLIGKNRLKKIEGLHTLTKLEVLDLHGNQISHVTGLNTLSELKVLNLAGNQIRLIGQSDLDGLISLQELNLKRNRLKKLLGFQPAKQLQKLFLSNNEIVTIDDMTGVCEATELREITVDGNPVALGNDCTSFLVSYLPNLQMLSHMQVTEQVRKNASIWRTSREQIDVKDDKEDTTDPPQTFDSEAEEECFKLPPILKTPDGSKSDSESLASSEEEEEPPKTKEVKKPKTAKAKVKPQTKVREQGGDYLIEICGRCLNVFGQGALRFIDRPWNPSKSGDVTTVRFNYVNFTGIVPVLGKLKQRFPNTENFVFRETNIVCLGQLNALADVQGLLSLQIDVEGNPICQKSWKSYAIYRLSHWGLKIINGMEVTEEDIAQAEEEFQGLSDLVLWSLPDSLLQPLLTRLRIDGNRSNQSAKQWLWKADPALRSVVGKEALQWRRGTITQEDLLWRHKGRLYLGHIIDLTTSAIEKLRVLDSDWPMILNQIIRDTLVDYSHIESYMKNCMQQLQS